MKILQKIFDQELKNLFEPAKLGSELVRKRLEKAGIEVNENQIEKIKKQFGIKGNGVLHLEFEDEQIAKAGFESEEQLQESLGNLVVDLTKDLEEFSKDFFDNLPSLVMESTDDLSTEILEDLKSRAKEILEDRDADFFAFESNLYEVYSSAFELLEMLLVIAFEAGESFNEEERPTIPENENYVLDVLIRLHARACQISYEILTLLKAGLADGAHARWRSLHEISVTGIFISQCGNEIAEKYLLHHGVESYKAAKIYQDNCEALGFEPIEAEELSNIKEENDELINRFGKEYQTDYGWASDVIKKRRPTFFDIERLAGLNHLRPFYKMACNNVHANPSGLYSQLGLYPESDLLLAGPSNVGLTDPGQSTALSLTQITVTLLTLNPNIDRIVVCKMLMALEKEVSEAFVEAENSIKADHENETKPAPH